MENSNVLYGGVDLALQTVKKWGTEFYALLPNIIVGLFIFILFLGIAYGVSRSILRYFEKQKRIDLGRLLADFGFWVILSLGALVALTIVLPSVKPANLLASLGLGSLAIGIAFKEILQNWLSGLLILLRLPFRRGDQILVGDVEGSVMRIEPRATVIRTYDGIDIVVPNKEIYTGVVAIQTSQERRRVEIDFTVGYGYDIRKIIETIEKALMQIDEIIKDPPPQILCWELGSTSLGLKVRWWISSERSQEVVTRARAVHAIKEAFDANDIDPTDPQLIYYKNVENGSAIDNENSYEFDTVCAVNPPFKVSVSHNDPESEMPKKDRKEETLLSED